MSDKRDYYEVLGVPRNVDDAALKKAFRKLAKQYHPDANKEASAADRFKEISEAYEVLSDGDKRARYDRFGHAGLNGAGGGDPFSDFGVADIFEQFFGGRRGSSRRSGPKRGADLRHNMTIEFEEAVFGVDKTIEVTRPEYCDHCDGKGAEPGTQVIRCTTCNGSGEVRRVQQSILGQFVNVTTCSTCNGTGEMFPTPCSVCNGQRLVRKTRSLNVKVPPGVDGETQIRLSNEGAPGERGAPNGHLYVFIRVRDHAFFRRRNDDILLDLQINVAQAALGDEVTVPTVDGDTKLAIPAGTQSGKVFRMRNHGVPHLRREGRGDQMVVIQVNVPTSLSDEQEELFEQLARTLGREVVPQRDRGFLNQIKDALGDVFGI